MLAGPLSDMKAGHHFPVHSTEVHGNQGAGTGFWYVGMKTSEGHFIYCLDEASSLSRDVVQEACDEFNAQAEVKAVVAEKARAERARMCQCAKKPGRVEVELNETL